MNQPGKRSRAASARKQASGKPRRAKSRAPATPRRSAAAVDAELATQTTPAFPVVGLGASAGGLEALEKFLRSVPEGSGIAFVVVQHLDPTQRGMLVELLQRATAMPVAQVVNQQRVEPDHVYVIPPNKDISLLHGRLHLLPQVSPRGLNLPIDFFFRSLAEDQQEHAIGVILSGMGSDGTLGLRAIKEKAGACFVQSPATAQFDGMPRSAIDAGLADVVAPPEELPLRILAFRKHAPHMQKRPEQLEEATQSALQRVFALLKVHTGNEFSQYKRSTVQRRIERRMGLHQIDDLERYVRYLRENPREIDLLFKELLIGVTSFFRDPAAWEQLKNQVLPGLLAARAPGGLLRAWVPGCSTGEEAYSLAIVFKEALEPLKPVHNLALQIFATDLDRDAIEKARSGIYPGNIAADVSADRLRRFFVQEERGFRISKEIREMVVFAPQNIIMDPPFTKLDILVCRNLLIYLSAELQKKLIPLFHYSLYPGGLLFLGTAETIGSFSRLFTAVDSKSRIYQRVEPSEREAVVEFPSRAFAGSDRAPDPAAPAGDAQPPSNLQALADRVLVQRFSPAAVLCNDKGDILYISGRTGEYLEPAVGKANLNILAMAREGLRHELARAFASAVRHDRQVAVRGLRVRTNGGTRPVDLTVMKLVEPKELRGRVLVVIADAAAAGEEPPAAPRARQGRIGGDPRVARLEGEVQRAKDEAQTTREEMQTSQEELKSTNEELQSTNEELQSTNEELTTSKEEMQSLNEELQTVNHELQAKVDELSRSNNDMKNLLNSTDIATLFLDGELRVRRFTTPTAKIINLIPGDAGRRVTDITSELDYPGLSDDAREVLRTLTFSEKQVAARDGRWFTVRIMPYRTLENVIDGVVITFTDTTVVKLLRNDLERSLALLTAALERGEPYLAVDGRLTVTTASPAAQAILGNRQIVGRKLGEVLPVPRDLRLEQELKDALRRPAPASFERRVQLDGGVELRLVHVHPQPDIESTFVLVTRCDARDERGVTAPDPGRSE
ncbi:MAG: PAS domain-containing protein [Acidobacteria bacterium]|nr:PAS domain-containing protein [Acidobacteriota bacterium]